MSAVAHVDAILAALTATGVNAHEPNTAPTSADPPYAVVHADLGRGETCRMSGRTRLSAWRFVVMVVGTTPNNARVVADRVRAVEGTRVAIPGTRNSVLLNLESSSVVGLDDPDVPSVYSGSLVFTFASERTD